MNQFKLVYQSGKGSKRLVPVLIPDDTVEPLRILVQKREQCCIPKSNIFLFPSTGSSTSHVSGWNIVKDVTKLVDGLVRPDLLIADKFRHRAATMFALTEFPEEKREAFYKHMGHSQQINRDVYQCPLALREVTEVGKFLQGLDQDSHAPETDEPTTVTSNPETEQLTQASAVSFEQMPVVAVQQALSVTCDETKRVKTGRRYCKWSIKNTELIKEYFRNYIQDSSSNGVQGSLPSQGDIGNFLVTHPIFKDSEGSKFSSKEQINLVKTKVFNERKKARVMLNKIRI